MRMPISLTAPCHLTARGFAPKRRASRQWMIWLSALMLAILAQGITARPTAAQEANPSGVITCSNPQTVYSVVSNSYSAEPVLNSDGSLVYFWSTGNAAGNNGDGNIEIVRAKVNLDGATLLPQFSQLTNSTGSILGGFNLSPSASGDGRYVAFFSDRDLIPGQNRDGNFEIFRWDNQNNQLLQVTNTTRGSNLFPSISQDGMVIAFVSDNGLDSRINTADANRNLEIFVYSAENATRPFTQVTNTALGVTNEDPAISGDGKTLVFVSDKDGNSEIYRYQLNGGQTEQITSTSTGVNAHPSPDNKGDRIVFLSDRALDTGGGSLSDPQVFLYPNPDKPGEFKRLTNIGAHGHPAIDGSGNRVVYQRASAGLENIFLYDLASGAEKQLTQSDATKARANPAISRSGTVVVYEDNGGVALVNCPIADLELTVNETASVTAGEFVTYTWQVTNNGSSSASNVEIKSNFPIGFNLNTSTSTTGCTQTGINVTCVADQLAVGSSAAFTLTVSVAPGELGEIPLIVTAASSSVSDPIPANNRRTIITTVDARADLVLSQLPFAGVPPLNGELITYTLILKNEGPSVARTVRITNTLPAEVIFQSSGAGCSQSAGVVTCTQGQMTLGQIMTHTIVARVASLNEIEVVNTAVARADTLDPDLTNNSATRSNPINTTHDLSISQQVTPANLVAGAPISFTLTVTNAGPSIARAVELSVTLPAQFQPALGNDGRPLFCALFTCTVGAIDTTQPFTLSLGDLGVATRVVSMGGIIDATYSGPITSTATVNSVVNTEADRNPANNITSQMLSVVQGADLSILPVTRLSEIVAGAPATYSITVRNDGPSSANSLVLTYSLPISTVFVSAASLANCSGTNLISCEFAQLLPGDTLVLTVTSLIDAAYTGVLTYTAGVTSAIMDTDPVFNTRTITDTVITRANLVLRNEAAPLSAISGQDSITFTLTITNDGPSLAPAVVLTDVLPTSLTPLQILPPSGVSCGPLANTIVCSLDDMMPGAVRTVRIRASVKANATGSIVNVATVDSGITDPKTVNSAAVTTVQRADLHVVKDAVIADLNSNGLIDVGERITYTVVVSNSGPSNASGIVISDQIPSLLSGVIVSTAQGSFANDVWTVGALAAGSQTTMTVGAILGEATSGQTITNTAVISTANQLDPLLENNGQTLPLTVTLAADLAVAMSVSIETPKVRDLVTYRITVTNNGPETAPGVVVTDLLPPTLTYVTHTLTAGSYNSGNGRWTMSSLPNGESRTLVITATVIGSGNIINTASVAGSLHDHVPSNNTASTTLSVGPAADLSLTQIFSDETPNVNDTLVIVLQVNNNGPDTAENIQVRYVIPPLMSGATVTPQGAATYSTTTGIWTIPSLASGESSTLSISRLLSASGGLTSTAEIIASGLFDPDSTPNNGVGRGEDDETTVTKTIPKAADLAVTKSVNAGPFREGSTVFYTLLVKNNGPDPATNVVVTETLPAELQFLTFAFAGNPSSYNPTTSIWDVGSLAVNETKTLFISTRVRPGTAGKQIVDATDGSRSDQYDWNPANDVSDPVSIVIDGADLVVQKTVSNERPNAGETLVYIVTVTNDGPIATTNVVVVDKLPAGITHVENLASQGIYTATNGTWTVGNLAVNASATLVLTTTVNAGTGGTTITNTVTAATSSVADGDLTNNTPSRAVSVQQADLTVRIDPLEPNPVEGQIIGYNIVVANDGPDLATNVVLTHSLPISLENRGGGPTQGNYDDTTNTWYVGNLARGSSALLNFFAEPKIGTGGQQIDLTVDALNADQEDPSPAVTAKGTITVVGADLTITRIDINDDTPATFSTLIYTVTVRNNGPSHTSGIDLRNPVPAGTLFISATNGGALSGGSIVWPKFSLNAGATITRSYTLSVTAGSGFTITTVPRLFGSILPDNISANDALTRSVVVNQPPIITIGNFSNAFEGRTTTATGSFVDDDSTSWPLSTVNYGDGSGTKPLTLNGKNFALSHIYADNGVYTVTVTIGDIDGNISTQRRAVTIANVAPTVTAHPDITSGIVEGGRFTVTNIATFADPGFNTETFTYTVNWGDNITSTGAVIGVINGSAGISTTGAITGSHTYADNRVYTVTVTIFDDDGGNQSRSFTINVGNVAPTILTSPADQTVDEGALLNLPMMVTFADPGWTSALRGSSETFTYTINWGDSSPAVTLPVTNVVNGSVGVSTTGSFGGSHTYANDGVYPVTITLRDDDAADAGGTATAAFTVTVNNVAPTIIANAGAQTIDENQRLTLTHMITFTDPGFSALGKFETFTYTIDWGDGSDEVTGAVSNVTNGAAGAPTVGSVSGSHTYADDDNSPYTATVTVFDNGGGSDTTSFPVTVRNVAPTLTVTNSQTITEGYLLDLPGIASFVDPGYTDPTVNASETFTYSIDWGDGSALVIGVPAVNNGSAGVSTSGVFSGSYTYADDGVYTVTVSIYDDNGSLDAESFTVTVVNEVPALSLATVPVQKEGTPFTVTNILTFTDPGWTDPLLGASETFTYIIDWGDGNQTSAAVTDLINGGVNVATRGGVTATHTYSDDAAGPYTVIVTLADDDGGVVSDTLTISVENVDPEVTPAADQSATQGAPSDLALGSFIDPGADAPWTVAVNWGDGAEVITFTRTVSGVLPATTHTYTAKIEATVTVTVTDKDGGWDSANFTVAVDNVQPTVTPPADQTATEGFTQTFTLGSFSDPGTDIWTVTVDWGDGLTTTLPPFSTPGTITDTDHTYADSGLYTVTVTVNDGNPGGIVSAQFTVTVANVAPSISNILGGQTFAEGQTFTLMRIITFTDPGFNTETFTYTVDWGDNRPGSVITQPVTSVLDGSIGVSTTGSVTESYTYADNGNYTVTVTIRDREGAAVSDTIPVTVTNVAPTITDIVTGTTVAEGQTFTLTRMITFTDPGFNTETFTYTVNWGDGSAPITRPVTSLINGSPGMLTTGSLTESHTYADNGNYTVTVAVRDDDGGVTTRTTLITVTNVAPSISNILGGQTFGEGQTFTLTRMITFTDPGFNTETFTYTVDWGDNRPGSVITQPVTSLINGSVGVATRGSITESYTYGDNGNYTVTVTIRDDDSGVVTGTIPVTVTNVAPTITDLVTGTTVNEGQPFTLTRMITFTDPGFSAETFTYTVTWGDSSAPITSSVTSVFNGSPGVSTTGAITVSHTYTDNGNFTATVAIRDKDGGVASRSTVITVTNVAPTATFTNSGPVTEGMTVTVGFSNQFDPSEADTDAGFRYVYSCDNNDLGNTLYGSASTSSTTTCLFGDDGSYPVRGVIIDKDNGRTQYTTTVTVTNVAPTISGILTGTTVAEGQTFTLTNVITFADPGFPSETFTYTVDWDDGTVVDGSVTSVFTGSVGVSTTGALTVTHTYTDNRPLGVDGNYTATVTIGDKDGGTVSRTIPITVTNVAPTATFTNSGPVTEGMTVTVGFSNQFDPSLADTNAGFKYAYDCNNADLSGEDYDSAGIATSAECNFGDNGSYDVRGVIIDKDGRKTQYTTTVTVTNVAPTITDILTGMTVDEGQTFTLTNVITFADPGFPSETFTYTVDWNDGNISAGNVTSVFTGSAGISTTSSLTVSHTYGDNGNYTVTVTIRDKDGGVVTGTIPITVTNVPPTIADDIGGQTFAEGQTFTLTNVITFADPGFPSETFTYTVDWDDGTVVDGSVTSVFTGSAGNLTIGSLTVTHTYTDNRPLGVDGIYTATVTIGDKDGGTVSRTIPITVTNVAPTATFTNSGPVTEGMTVTVGFSNQFDPSLADTNAGFKYAYDCNNADLSGEDYDSAGIATSAECNFGDNGSYDVRGVIIDKDNGLTQYTTTVTVTNVAPTITDILTGTTVAEGQTFTLTNVITFADPGFPSETFTYTVDWGDGNIISADVEDVITGSLGVSTTGSLTVSHRYANDGNYSVGIIIRDKDGGEVTGTIPITVTNLPPIANDDTAFTDEDAPIDIDVLANDDDVPDDKPLLVVHSVGAPNATAVITDSGKQIYYNPSPHFNYLPAGVTATDTFTYTVSDTVDVSNVATVTVTITGVNDAPTIQNLGGDTLTYTEGDGPVVIDQGANAKVSDVDSPNFDSGTLTVTIISGVNAEDRLSINDEGTGAEQIGVSGNDVSYEGTDIGSFAGGSNGAPLVISLSDSANITSTSALLRNITYENIDTNSPTAGNRTVRFVLADGDGDVSSNVDTTVTVSSVNDAPEVSIDGPFEVRDELELDLSGTIAITDVDAGTGIISVTLEVSSGVLMVTSSALATEQIVGNGTANVEITGTINAITTTLGSNDALIYRNIPTITGTQTLTVTVNDRGNSGGDNVEREITATATITVQGRPDLKISKSDGLSFAAPGDVLTYTIAYTNAGSGPAQGVRITETVPDNTRFVSMTGTSDWNCADNSGATTPCVVSGFELNPGDSGVVTFTVQITSLTSAGTVITNTVTIGDNGNNGPDKILGDNSAQDGVTVAVASLQISKSAAVTSVEAGQLITYTIHYTNAGSVTATGIRITETVPVSTVFVTTGSSATWSCADGSGAGSTCSILHSTTNNSCLRGTGGGTGCPAVTSGEKIFVVRVVLPVSSSLSHISNVAQVGASTGSPANSNTVVTPLSLPNLSVHKTASPSPVIAGSTITYSVVVSNAAGAATATNVTISDTLPVSVTLVQSSTVGLSCSSASPIRCSVSSLNAGSAVTLTITGTVSALAPSGLTITNTAAVTYTQVITTLTASVSTTVNRSTELTITKLVTPTTAIAGEQITYTIVATNTGPSQASNVTISDTVPLSVTGVISISNGLSCSGAAPIRCSVASLAVNVPVTLTISGILSSTLPSSVAFTNTATVTSTESSTPVTATVAMTPTRQVTFEIVKRAVTESVQAGAQITYTIVATNTGPSQASSVTISDTLPLSVTLVNSSTVGGLSCNSETPIRCSVATLNVGSAVTLTITGTVSAVAPSGLVITNTATVTATERLTLTASNALTTTVTRDVSFAISKIVKSAPINAGEQITYAVIITNTGSQSATNMVLTDTLPVSVTVVTSSTLGGLTNCSDTTSSGATTISCSAPSLNAGTVATLTITGAVDAALPAGIITNTAGVTSQEVTTPQLTTVGKEIFTSSDLRVSIDVTPTTGPLYGDTLTYTVNITNSGPSFAQNTFVTVTLPISVAFNGVETPPVGFTGPTANGQQRGWNATSFGVTSTQIVFTGTITGTGVISANVVITSTTSDPTADNSANTSDLTVPNQAPVVDLNGADAGIDYTATFTEDMGNVAIVNSTALTVTDMDSTHLVSATVTLTNVLDIATESLTVTVGSGISAVYDSATGVLSLTGNASPAAYAAVLRTATYTNTSQDPNTTQRIIRFVVSDGDKLSATATTTLTVISVNDAPILNLQAITTTGYITTTSGLMVIAPSATVTDVDTPILNGGILTVTIRTGGHISDTIVISPTAQITVSSGITVNHNGVAIGAYVPGAGSTAQLTVTFNNTATVARVQDLLRAIAFSNTVSPGLVDRVVDWALSDGVGGVSITQTITVVVEQEGDNKSLFLPEDWLPSPANEEETANSPLYLYLPLIGVQQPTQGMASDPPGEPPPPPDAMILPTPPADPEGEDGQEEGEASPDPDADTLQEAMPSDHHLYLPSVQKD